MYMPKDAWPMHVRAPADRVSTTRLWECQREAPPEVQGRGRRKEVPCGRHLWVKPHLYMEIFDLCSRRPDGTIVASKINLNVVRKHTRKVLPK